MKYCSSSAAQTSFFIGIHFPVTAVFAPKRDEKKF